MEQNTTTKTTSDTILAFMKQAVEDKHKLDGDVWIDAAQKLNILLIDEMDILFDYQQKLAVKVNDFYKGMDKPTMARAEAMAIITPEWLNFKKQDAKIKQINEFVRIAKKRVDMIRGY